MPVKNSAHFKMVAGLCNYEEMVNKNEAISFATGDCFVVSGNVLINIVWLIVCDEFYIQKRK